ncbi:MAG: hypothetical protein JWO53_1203 [Chlamydiia bacterium]|nr:hypothetical protein [Chlamydiia bacterium]
MPSIPASEANSYLFRKATYIEKVARVFFTSYIGKCTLFSLRFAFVEVQKRLFFPGSQRVEFPFLSTLPQITDEFLLTKEGQLIEKTRRFLGQHKLIEKLSKDDFYKDLNAKLSMGTCLGYALTSRFSRRPWSTKPLLSKTEEKINMIFWQLAISTYQTLAAYSALLKEKFDQTQDMTIFSAYSALEELMRDYKAFNTLNRKNAQLDSNSCLAYIRKNSTTSAKDFVDDAIRLSHLTQDPAVQDIQISFRNRYFGHAFLIQPALARIVDLNMGIVQAKNSTALFQGMKAYLIAQRPTCIEFESWRTG